MAGWPLYRGRPDDNISPTCERDVVPFSATGLAVIWSENFMWRTPIVVLLGCSIFMTIGTPPARAETEKTQSLETFGGLTVGQPAPWFAGWTTEGQVWNLNGAFKESGTQRLALVLWASWCKPCRAGLVALAAAADSLREAGVEVVLVGLDRQEADARRFLEKTPLPFTCVLDPFNNATLKFLGMENDGQEQPTAPTLPLTVVLDRQRVVVAIYGAEGPDYLDLLLGRP
jgi:peroxiredoxin